LFINILTLIKIFLKINDSLYWRHSPLNNRKISNIKEDNNFHHPYLNHYSLWEALLRFMEWSSRISCDLRIMVRPSIVKLLQLRDIHIFLYDEFLRNTCVFCNWCLEQSRCLKSRFSREILSAFISCLVNLLYCRYILYLLSL
jgi:hypothetical protein